MQVAGKGEAKNKVMVNTSNLLIVGTIWADKINTDNAWKKAHTKHLEILQPVKVKGSEDRWVNWFSNKNINYWKYRVKDLLVDMNMVKDEPGWMSKTYLLVYFFTIYMFKISHCFFSKMVYGPRCHTIILMMSGIFSIQTKHNTSYHINYSMLWNFIFTPFRRACCRKFAP